MMNGWNLEHTYTGLPAMFFRRQMPTPAPAPQVAVFNHELAERLGLRSYEPEMAAKIFSGSALPPGAQPIAQAYAGHQFGHFTMLGDGRAILLGEQGAPDGRKFDVQLKGSGRTMYSRGGDGLAALAPMLREYIISQAMAALGIPTTRSLAVVLTGGSVMREEMLPGAVLTRVAASHIRVGTFDYVSAYGSGDDLRALADYCISRHFPQLAGAADKYLLLLREICSLQAGLIARWQLAGFVHGVMNTDNMAISGETIDYGPCAFMDAYHPDTVFSSIDTFGRYAYKNQPGIGAWNLSRLAEALLPLLGADKDEAIQLAQAEISGYLTRFDELWFAGMCAKLGFTGRDADDAPLISELLGLMEEHRLDYTNTFRTQFEAAELSDWREKWRARLARTHQSPGQAADMMNAHNPAVIPRNHRVEEALAAAGEGDFSVMHRLLAALAKPFEDNEEYAAPPASATCAYKTFCGT